MTTSGGVVVVLCIVDALAGNDVGDKVRVSDFQAVIDDGDTHAITLDSSGPDWSYVGVSTDKAPCLSVVNQVPLLCEQRIRRGGSCLRSSIDLDRGCTLPDEVARGQDVVVRRAIDQACVLEG